MSGSEPVTSPDQHKQLSRRPWQIGALLTAVVIVLMVTFGNHQGRVENLWGYGIAALLVAIPIGDEALRRAGLRS